MKTRRACLLLPLNHSLKRNLCRHHLPVTRRQIAVDVETSVARRRRVLSCATGDTERYAVSIRGGADGGVRHQHEGVPFDKDLIAGLEIRISRSQVEDYIGRRVGTRRENGGVVAAFRVNSRARETQLDVLRKGPAPSDIWPGIYQIKVSLLCNRD